MLYGSLCNSRKEKRLACYTCEQYIFVQLKPGVILTMTASRPAFRRLILKGAIYEYALVVKSGQGFYTRELQAVDHCGNGPSDPVYYGVGGLCH